MVELDRLRGNIRLCMYLDHLPSEGHVPGPGRRPKAEGIMSALREATPTEPTPQHEGRESTFSARQALYAEGWQYGVFYRNGLRSA